MKQVLQFEERKMEQGGFQCGLGNLNTISPLNELSTRTFKNRQLSGRTFYTAAATAALSYVGYGFWCFELRWIWFLVL